MGRAAFAYAIGAALALLALGRLETPYQVFEAQTPRDLFLGADPANGLLLGLGVGLALAALSELLSRFTRWGRAVERVIHHVVGDLHPLDALLLAALSGVCEELLFRGLALPYFGLAASSVVFGLAHLVPRKGLWVWSLWAMGAGFVLGWLAQRTGSLGAPIAAHVAINAVGLLTLPRRFAAAREE